MITFALVMLVVITVGLSTAHLLRVSFGVALPSALFAIVVVLYAFGLANLLAAGFVVVLVLIAAAAVVSVIRVGPRAVIRSAPSVLTPALVVFVVFGAATFALTRYLQLASWDEFTHWGSIVKATLSHDAISPYNPIDLVFRSYPPGLTLFEYFVTKLGRGWSESNLLWSYQLLLGTLFLPFIGSLQWRQWPRLAVVLPIMALTPIVFFNSFQGVLVDPLLGLLFGYALALAYTGDVRSRLLPLQLSLAVAMLILTKDSGLVFSIIAIAVLLVRVIRAYRPFRSRAAVKDAGLVVGVPIASVVLAYASWKAILAALAIRVTFSEPIDPGELPGLFDGTGRPYWNDVMSAFGSALTGLPLTTGNGIPVPHLAWLVITAAALVALELVRSKRAGVPARFGTAIIVLVGAVAYTIGLLVLYLYRFTDYEAVHLAAFERYLGTYWVGVIALVSFCVIAIASEAADASPSAGRLSRWPVVSLPWLVALLAFAPLLPFAHFVVDTARGDNHNPRPPVIDAAAAAGVDGDDRVWIISEYSSGFEYWVVRYELMPSPVNEDSWSLGPPRNADDVWTADLTPTEWEKRLDGYDYVVVQASSPDFRRTYAELFADPDDAVDNSVFRIDSDTDGITLVRVGAP